MFEIFDASAIFGINPYWLLIAVSWSLAWKGIALWKSAQKKSVPWFVVLLVFNTLGILPILYIFLFSKLGGKKTAIKTTMKKPKARKKKRRKK